MYEENSWNWVTHWIWTRKANRAVTSIIMSLKHYLFFLPKPVGCICVKLIWHQHYTAHLWWDYITVSCRVWMKCRFLSKAFQIQAVFTEIFKFVWGMGALYDTCDCFFMYVSVHNTSLQQSCKTSLCPSCNTISRVHSWCISSRCVLESWAVWNIHGNIYSLETLGVGSHLVLVRIKSRVKMPSAGLSVLVWKWNSYMMCYLMVLKLTFVLFRSWHDISVAVHLFGSPSCIHFCCFHSNRVKPCLGCPLMEVLFTN